MSDQVNDLLLGMTGAPVLSFPQDQVGTTHKGTVVSSRVQQATDIDGKPKFFENSGDPMMDVVITLQTDLRDPNIDDDDGRRRIFAGHEMQIAIGLALREAGCKLEDGGTLAVQHNGNRPSKRNGINPAKTFRAEYRPPVAGAGVNDLLGSSNGGVDASGPAQPQAVQPQAQPAQAQAQPASSLL